jgi:pimeloyl-ACP methyl ester carboxylesterase
MTAYSLSEEIRSDLTTTPVSVDVSELVPFPGTFTLNGWIRTSSLRPSASPILLCCLAGGKCSTGYFDLQVDGFSGYSMADHLAARGFLVVAFDHLGVGESSSVEDIFLVTPRLASAVNDYAHRTVMRGLVSGTLVPGLRPLPGLVPIGVGHSMGGMLLGVQQARHATFAAVAILGHGVGLPTVLTDEELSCSRDGNTTEETVVTLARARFAVGQAPGSSRPPPGSFLPRELPEPVRAAFMAQQTDLLFACGLTSMLPGSTDREKAAITAPVFLGFGEDDLTQDFMGCVALYQAANDISLFVLPGAAHCHNQSALRTTLWDRLAHWARGYGSTSDTDDAQGAP